jgi:hypothetical protein
MRGVAAQRLQHRTCPATGCGDMVLNRVLWVLYASPLLLQFAMRVLWWRGVCGASLAKPGRWWEFQQAPRECLLLAPHIPFRTATATFTATHPQRLTATSTTIRMPADRCHHSQRS